MKLESFLLGKKVKLDRFGQESKIIHVIEKEETEKSLIDTSAGMVCGLWMILEHNPDLRKQIKEVLKC